jgi:hypothetical protein
MSAMQFAGTLLIAGSLTFWIGAGFSWKVWVQPDAEKMAQIITKLRPYWIISHILFVAAVGSVAIGLGVFTSIIEAATARPLAIVGLVAIGLGSIVWAYIVIRFRLSMPPEELVRTTAGAWTFPAFTLLTLGALILYGLVLLMSGFPTWLGTITVGLSGLILIAFLSRRNVIPAVFYVVTLIMGIAFLL